MSLGKDTKRCLNWANNTISATEELVTITITHDTTTAHHCVKRKLLCETSIWFKNALKDEAVSHVRMHEGTVYYECIKHYIHWLNTGTLASMDPPLSGWVRCAGDKEYRLLKALWFFGEKYSAPGLQDAAVSAMLARMESSKASNALVLPGKSCINFTYHKESNVSKPRRSPNKLQEVFVEMYAIQDSATQLEEIQEGLSWAFLADLCKRQNALLRSPRPGLKRLTEDNACEFHQHGIWETCDAGGPAAKRRRRESIGGMSPLGLTFVDVNS